MAELDEKLYLPVFPEELRYLWRIYHRLRNRKGAGLAGPSPWEWPDLDAFVRNSRMPLAPWEVEILEALDDVFLTSKS